MLAIARGLWRWGLRTENGRGTLAVVAFGEGYGGMYRSSSVCSMLSIDSLTHHHQNNQ